MVARRKNSALPMVQCALFDGGKAEMRSFSEGAAARSARGTFLKSTRRNSISGSRDSTFRIRIAWAGEMQLENHSAASSYVRGQEVMRG